MCYFTCINNNNLIFDIRFIAEKMRQAYQSDSRIQRQWVAAGLLQQRPQPVYLQTAGSIVCCHTPQPELWTGHMNTCPTKVNSKFEMQTSMTVGSSYSSQFNHNWHNSNKDLGMS